MLCLCNITRLSFHLASRDTPSDLSIIHPHPRRSPAAASPPSPNQSIGEAEKIPGDNDDVCSSVRQRRMLPTPAITQHSSPPALSTPTLQHSSSQQPNNSTQYSALSTRRPALNAQHPALNKPAQWSSAGGSGERSSGRPVSR